MTAAEEHIFDLRRVTQAIGDAVIAGAGSKDDIEEALEFSASKIERQRGTRIFALQALGTTRDAAELLMSVSATTNSLSLTQAKVRLDQAARLFEDMANALAKEIQEAVSQHERLEVLRRDKVMPSGDLLRMAVTLITDHFPTV